MFEEMRLAAVLQAVRRQPGRRCPPATSLWMATRAGARTLGLEHEIGSIEVGKRADLIVVDRDRPHLAPGPDPYSTLVYAARGSDVRTTIVDGEVLVDDFAPVRVDPGRGRVQSRRRAASWHPGRSSDLRAYCEPLAVPASAGLRVYNCLAVPTTRVLMEAS